MIPMISWYQWYHQWLFELFSNKINFFQFQSFFFENAVQLRRVSPTYCSEPTVGCPRHDLHHVLQTGCHGCGGDGPRRCCALLDRVRGLARNILSDRLGLCLGDLDHHVPRPNQLWWATRTYESHTWVTHVSHTSGVDESFAAFEQMYFGWIGIGTPVTWINMA